MLVGLFLRKTVSQTTTRYAPTNKRRVVFHKFIEYKVTPVVLHFWKLKIRIIVVKSPTCLIVD